MASASGAPPEGASGAVGGGSSSRRLAVRAHGAGVSRVHLFPVRNDHASFSDESTSAAGTGWRGKSVSIVEEYNDDDSASIYDLFDAVDAVGSGPCMDDNDTDPHVSMARGLKFKSSYHSQNYFFDANLEVAVWQAMYPAGVVLGSTKSSSFPLNGGTKQSVGYGSLFFFFDRANITQAFNAERDLYNSESYYYTLMSGGATIPSATPSRTWSSTTRAAATTCTAGTSTTPTTGRRTWPCTTPRADGTCPPTASRRGRPSSGYR
mmetsp:Transcript_29827/g.59060  ORF Transcript_29827/g.59060 Transcript_29827/m.59060 type:complete len:264 (-) Transcript_29827:275-1066(-)